MPLFILLVGYIQSMKAQNMQINRQIYGLNNQLCVFAVSVVPWFVLLKLAPNTIFELFYIIMVPSI